MLFGYPVEATEENWLHDCLCAIIQSIHTCLNIGDPIPSWPQLIPVERRGELTSRRGLRDRIDAYAEAARNLTVGQRAFIERAMLEQNRLGELLSGTANCAMLDEFPSNVKPLIVSLFGFAFELLSHLGVRDRQYKIIYRRLTSKVCPFCGCEYFDAPRAPREALDHYLAESLYPLAAVNLKNLVPMGSKCNSKYKLAKDILRNGDGTRRRAFDPYAAPGLQITLGESSVNGALDGPLISDWVISFTSACEEVETWDAVFSIRDRYRRDILSEHLNTWLMEFSLWLKSTGEDVRSDEDVLDAIDRYALLQGSVGFSDRAFLKAAVFSMLKEFCEKGNARVIAVMRDLTGASIA